MLHFKTSRAQPRPGWQQKLPVLTDPHGTCGGEKYEAFLEAFEV